jgi:opacity protein-like surface antigen
MKRVLYLFVAMLAFSAVGSATDVNLEAGLGYAHITGNGGLNGFNVDLAALFGHSKIAMAADYDGVYDTTNLGASALSATTGLITTKNHLQDILFGPRIYIPLGSKNKWTRSTHPFVEIELGSSHLNSSVKSAAMPQLNAGSSDSAFTWMLGGGLDYKLSSHWVARGKFDLLRTHFVNAGQSRFRLVLGVAYTIKPKS